MTQYNTLNLKLSNSLLDKLKSEINMVLIRGQHRKKKYTSNVRNEPKLAFQPVRLQDNDDPILSLRSPNKL